MSPDQNETPTPPAAPTAEDAQKAQQIAQAGVEASEQGQDPAQAMKAERDRVKLEIPDEQLEKMATMFSVSTIEALQQRGAFDTPPEPVRGPDAQEAPAHPSDQEAPVQAEEAPPQPEKRTWAHKFLGV
jgi:hypothetical protein